MALPYPTPLCLSCTSLSDERPCSSLLHHWSQSRLPRHFSLREGTRDRNPAAHYSFFSSNTPRRGFRITSALSDRCPSVVTQSTWDECILKSDIPVLVMFWASWCGPCRMVHPVFDEIAAEYVGSVKCFKLDADDDFQVTADYGVGSVPTVLFFKKGEKLESITGTMPKYVYEDAIKRTLAN